MDDADSLRRVDNSSVVSGTIPVLVAFAILGFDEFNVGVSVPFSAVIMGCVVFVAAFVAPTRDLPRPSWFPLLVVAIPVWMTMSTYINQVSGTKRIANVVMLALLALVISSGRVCVVSLARGAGLAVVLGTAYGLATLGSSGYDGRLTGGWGDPNNAGMSALILASCAFAYLSSRPGKILVAVAALTGIVATLSRTSIFALVVVILWVVAGDRVKVWIRLVVVSCFVWYVTTIPRSDYTSGVFAGREGSDALRERIDAATAVTVSQHPMYGSGAGTAKTTVQGDTFFFHNSYEALRAEGGWILLLIVLALYALLLLGLLRLPQQYRNHWLEAALLGALICAVNLGEVFLAPPVMVAVGAGARHLFVSTRRISMGKTLGDQSSPAPLPAPAPV